MTPRHVPISHRTVYNSSTRAQPLAPLTSPAHHSPATAATRITTESRARSTKAPPRRPALTPPPPISEDGPLKRGGAMTSTRTTPPPRLVPSYAGTCRLVRKASPSPSLRPLMTFRPLFLTRPRLSGHQY